eukprot:UN30995
MPPNEEEEKESWEAIESEPTTAENHEQPSSQSLESAMSQQSLSIIQNNTKSKQVYFVGEKVLRKGVLGVVRSAIPSEKFDFLYGIQLKGQPNIVQTTTRYLSKFIENKKSDKKNSPNHKVSPNQKPVTPQKNTKTHYIDSTTHNNNVNNMNNEHSLQYSSPPPFLFSTSPYKYDQNSINVERNKQLANIKNNTSTTDDNVDQELRGYPRQCIWENVDKKLSSKDSGSLWNLQMLTEQILSHNAFPETRV